MKPLLKYLRNRLKKWSRIYVPYREIKLLRNDRKLLLADAIRKFEEEKPDHGSFEDYKRAVYRHRVFYDEYMHGFEFWRMDEKKRKDFISDRELMCIYRKTVQKKLYWSLKNKVITLQMFADYVHRKWLQVSNTSFDVFERFVSSTDCIAKPLSGMKGEGVFKIEKDASKNMHELYLHCCKNDLIVEECVSACKEIEEFHPQSLNTIRVATISNGNKCELLDAMFRMGLKDSVVDNFSSGGIIASIDVKTGKILMQGVDKLGNHYEKHPESGKMIKGFVIPYWDKIVKTCKEMAKVIPELVFAGWDICVLPDGNIELVEANAVPLVSGGQIPTKMGLKPKLRSIGKEVLGYDPVKLISVWSKSYARKESK